MINGFVHTEPCPEDYNYSISLPSIQSSVDASTKRACFQFGDDADSLIGSRVNNEGVWLSRGIMARLAGQFFQIQFPIGWIYSCSIEMLV